MNYVTENFNPAGFIKVSSAPVISFDHNKKGGIPLNSWVTGTFKKGESRQADKGKRTQVLVFTAADGAEFAIGTTPHVRNAFESVGCKFESEDQPDVKTDLTPAIGRFFAFKNLGKVPGKKYFNVEAHVAPEGYVPDEQVTEESVKSGSKKK